MTTPVAARAGRGQPRRSLDGAYKAGQKLSELAAHADYHTLFANPFFSGGRLLVDRSFSANSRNNRHRKVQRGIRGETDEQRTVVKPHSVLRSSNSQPRPGPAPPLKTLLRNHRVTVEFSRHPSSTTAAICDGTCRISSRPSSLSSCSPSQQLTAASLAFLQPQWPTQSSSRMLSPMPGKPPVRFATHSRRARNMPQQALAKLAAGLMLRLKSSFTSRCSLKCFPAISWSCRGLRGVIGKPG